MNIKNKTYFQKVSKHVPDNIKEIIHDIIKNSHIEPFNDSIEQIIYVENIISLYTFEERNIIANKYNKFYDKFIAINKNLRIDVDKLGYYINYFTFLLKIKFNRPRPFLQAPRYNKKINHIKFNNIDNPSYPSGHSSCSRFLYRYFSDIDPKNDSKYFILMRKIILSRIIAGVHFKSDCEQGIIIADLLYDRLKKNNLLN